MSATEADARGAVLERRMDRVRQLLAAAEVIGLGHDDLEALRLDGDLAAFADRPGVRSPRR